MNNEHTLKTIYPGEAALPIQLRANPKNGQIVVTDKYGDVLAVGTDEEIRDVEVTMTVESLLALCEAIMYPTPERDKAQRAALDEAMNLLN